GGTEDRMVGSEETSSDLCWRYDGSGLLCNRCSGHLVRLWTNEGHNKVFDHAISQYRGAGCSRLFVSIRGGCTRTSGLVKGSGGVFGFCGGVAGRPNIGNGRFVSCEAGIKNGSAELGGPSVRRRVWGRAGLVDLLGCLPGADRVSGEA